MSSLLARHADCAFWLGRYVERAENLGRILDVTAALSRDSEGVTDAVEVWRQALDLNADEQRFREEGRELSADGVIRFYTLDVENLGSIRSCIAAARRNALQLRNLLSVEVWNQINGFHHDLGGRSGRPLGEHELSRFCEEVRQACQTHVGIVEGTLYRDEVWYFLLLGRMLERADMTARLIDLRAPQLAPRTPVSAAPLDVSQWTALLRSAAGLHAYRRVHLSALAPDRVAGFLIFDPHHGRSIRCAISAADAALVSLIDEYALPFEPATVAPLQELSRLLREESMTTVLVAGLHEFLDRVQRLISSTTDRLHAAYFVPNF